MRPQFRPRRARKFATRGHNGNHAMMDETKFSYGQLTDPTPFDEQFETEADVTSAAVEKSGGVHSTVLGVWRNADGELLAIIYDGEVYRPA